MRISRAHHYARILFEKVRRRYLERQAVDFIQNHAELRRLITDFQTISSGASAIRYKALYEYVKKHKPKEILECGSGVTTVVLAQAIKENGMGGGALPQWKRSRNTTLTSLQNFLLN